MAVDSRLRYARQIQLAEVGELGQQRIFAETLHVRGLDEKALSYAQRFGQAAGLAGGPARDRSEPLCSKLREAFRHDASRAVGLGAETALYSVLQAISPSSRS